MLVGGDVGGHHAVALTLGALIGEAELFVHGPRRVVEERRRGLLARRQVVRVRLDQATTRCGDQRERTADRDRAIPLRR